MILAIEYDIIDMFNSLSFTYPKTHSSMLDSMTCHLEFCIKEGRTNEEKAYLFVTSPSTCTDFNSV